MSFFHPTSASAARPRRTKEREGHPRASSVNNSGRRHGASSKNQDNRSPPSKSPVLQGSIYSQQNLTLDQMPGTPSAEASVSASASALASAPISPASSIYYSNSHRGGVIHLSQQPYTPIALQQYLDEDQDDDDENNEARDRETKNEKRASRSSDTASTVTDASSTVVERIQSQSLQSQKESPRSATIIPRNPTHDDNSVRTSEHLEFPSTLNRSISNIPLDMTSQRDSDNIVTRQLSSSDKLGTGGQRDDTIQVESSLPTEHASTQISRSNNDAIGLVATESRRRPLSQMINNADITTSSHENAELQTIMMRTTSHQSAPFMSRTFTPPAPPSGANRAPVQSSPVFASPIPIRSRMGGDNYANSYAPPPHYQSYQLPPNSIVPENYHVHPIFQDYTEASTMPYPPLPSMHTNFPTTSQSALPEAVVTQGYAQGEQNENPFVLISKLLSALPELQTFVAHCQQFGIDSGYGVPGLRGLEQENDAKAQYQALEEKHKEEILTLNGQIADLQARLRYVESDLADSKKSRNTLHEEFVVQRVESASMIKKLQDEKDELQKRCDRSTLADEEAKKQILGLRSEMDRERGQGKELAIQIEQLRVLYGAQETELKRAFDQKHDEYMTSHEQSVQDLKKQLDSEVVKSTTLSKQLKDLNQKSDDERRRLANQHESDKSVMTKNFEDKMVLLQSEVKAENTRVNRSLEENTRLTKEVDHLRRTASTDKARFKELIQSFQDAAFKINRENMSLQKIMTTCESMATDLQNRSNG